MMEDVGEVTTSLHRPAARHSRSAKPMEYDSFEWRKDPSPSGGVPRSAWTRPHRRLSRSHRPYVAILLLLDLAATLAAGWLAATLREKAKSGFVDSSLWFLHGDTLFFAFAYVILPLGWIGVLWANGTYDRRYLGLGSEEFKRVVRASVAVVACVSLLAFATVTSLSRGTV